jgi:Xaa-Pro aminopeptidase
MTDQHQGRLDRARQLMDESGVDFLFIGPSSDFRYFTGHPGRTSERLTALLIPLQGEPVIVVPRLEAPLVAHLSDRFSFEVWDETDDPIERVAGRVAQAGAESIGVNDEIWSGFLLQLQQQQPNRSYQRGADILSALRSVKDEDELALLREASRRTDQAWLQFCDTVQLSGRAENEVAADLMQTMADHGMPDIAFCIVAGGPNGASPHHHTGSRVIEPGDPVVIDFGGVYEGYYSDVTRTPVAGGEPPDGFAEAYAVVLEAQQTAFETIGPGVPAQEVDRAARKVITDHGYGEYFVHRLGHGIGMTGHEAPYLVEGNETLLQPGMVVSDEPGIYIPGRWGIRIEDTVVVTEDGRERYNHVPRDLTVLR